MFVAVAGRRRGGPWATLAGRGGLAAAVALSLALLVSPVAAQEAAGTEAPLSEGEAQGIFAAGRAAFQEGRYEAALGHFQRAFELSGRATLQYNIAIAAERLRRDELALEAFEAFLTGVPDTPRRVEVERRMELLRKAIADRAASEAKPAPASDEPAAPAPEAATSAAPAAAPATEESSGGRLWTWVFLGTGVAAAAGSGVLWWQANESYDELSDRCHAEGCTQGDVDDSSGPTLVTLHQITLGVSAAALIGAAVAYFVEGDAEAREPSVQLGAGPDGVHVQLELARLLREAR